VLAEVQGSFTFPPQQMPHASFISRITTLESRGEQSLRLCARRSCWRWGVSDLDAGIGAKKVYSRLKAHSMIYNNGNKTSQGNKTLLCSAYSSNMACKAQ